MQCFCTIQTRRTAPIAFYIVDAGTALAHHVGKGFAPPHTPKDGNALAADRDQLLDLVYRSQASPKQVFVAMGEERSSLFLVQRLRDYLGVNAIAPSENQLVEINF